MRFLVVRPSAKRRNADALVSALEAAGHDVFTVTNVDPRHVSRYAPEIDLVIPWGWTSDYVTSESPCLRATHVLERCGYRLLHSSRTLMLASNKLASATRFAQCGLLHPLTFRLDAQERWPLPGLRMVVKPAFGSGGRGVQVVGTIEQARAAAAGWLVTASEIPPYGPAILQELVQGTSVRVVATAKAVLTAYEKSRPDGSPVASVGLGAVRTYVEAPPELEFLAMSAVTALGGQLMGVDLVVRGERAWVLEANAPFAFERQNRQLLERITRAIEEVTACQQN